MKLFLNLRLKYIFEVPNKNQKVSLTAKISTKNKRMPMQIKRLRKEGQR